MDRPQLSKEEIKYIVYKQIDLVHLINNLDERNKDFLKQMWKGIILFGLAILVFIAKLLGSKNLTDTHLSDPDFFKNYEDNNF